jgi:hypothetical protein
MGQNSSASSTNVAAFILHVAVVLTVARTVFSPYTSVNGTEYAFVLTGPEWTRALAETGAEPGLSARIYWVALGGQLATLWAIAIGALWFLRQPPRPSRTVQQPE